MYFPAVLVLGALLQLVDEVRFEAPVRAMRIPRATMARAMMLRGFTTEPQRLMSVSGRRDAGRQARQPQASDQIEKTRLGP